MQFHRIVSDINLDQWDNLVARSSGASFFQTPSCYYFYDSLTFLKPFVFGVSVNKRLVGVICGYVISDGNIAKRFFSRRAIVPGGALLDDNISEKALTLLLVNSASELKKQAIYFEFRNYSSYSLVRTIFEKSGFAYKPHLNFHVATPDVETALKNLSTTKRRDIKISGKEGAEWLATTDTSDVHDYYKILSELYKSKIKTPLFPLEFFEKLVKLPEARLFVVKHKQKVIGGSVCVLLPGKSVYEWFVCGLDGLVKNTFPSTMATWAAIEFASNNEYNCFDMMGAGKPHEGYGVREFKARFGGDLVEHGRFLHINNESLYKLGKKVVYIRNKKKPNTNNLVKNKPVYTIESNILQIDKSEWRSFVEKHPNGTIFQSPEMYDLYDKTPNYNPKILIVKKDKNTIVGCLMSVIQREYKGFLGHFTVRSIVMGGPLVKDESTEISDLLLSNYIENNASTVIYSQFRNIFDNKILHTSFTNNDFEYVEHLDILIDLKQSVEDLRNNLHKERKRNIAKAKGEGLVFKKLESKEDILDLIDILKQTYKRVKTPLAHENLFLEAKNILKDNVSYFGAYYENKMIAGQIRLNYGNTAYAWFSGSDENYFAKRPNDFLLWNVLLWYKQMNYSSFDFGGAGKPNVHYGVRDYKLKYGGTVVNFGRYECTHKRTQMLIGKIAYKLYKLYK